MFLSGISKLRSPRAFCFFIIFMIYLIPGIFSEHIWDFLHQSGTEDKVELAKKIGSALLLAYRSKKFMFPLPFPVPVPIPIYKTYQAVIHDPWFHKKQLLTGGLAGGYGGYGGGGVASGGLAHLAALGKLGGVGLGGLGHGFGGHGIGLGGGLHGLGGGLGGGIGGLGALGGLGGLGLLGGFG